MRLQNVTYTDLVNILEASIHHPIDPCEVPEQDKESIRDLNNKSWEGILNKLRQATPHVPTHVIIPIDLARKFIHADRFKWDEQWATLAEMEKVIKEQLK